MDLAAGTSAATDTLAIVAGPAVGAAIALLGIYVNQRMQRSTQVRSRHRDEVRDLAADLLSLAETLWRRGWGLWQASQPVVQATDRDAVEKLLPEQLAAMQRENETHEKILSAQRRLMLTCPRLDEVASRLIGASRLWPPPIKRPGKDEYSRREMAERAFIEAVRKELGTSPN